jgi:hypothetical protein
VPAVHLYRWSDLEWCKTYCTGLQRLHRIGVVVDLELLLPAELSARLNALPLERINAIVDDPVTYVHLYTTTTEATLDEYIETAITGQRYTDRELRPGVAVSCEGNLHLHAGSQLCRPEETRGLSRDEQTIALAKLTRAFELLEALSPCAYHLVALMKRRLSLRSSTLEGCFFGSNRATVGTLYFTNLEQASPITIVTSLVHEAIHDSLFILERSHPLLVQVPPLERPHPASLLQVAREASAPNGGAMDAWAVRSPWTGRELPLETYVHAVFVWFGLLNLLEVWRNSPPIRPRPCGRSSTT